MTLLFPVVMKAFGGQLWNVLKTLSNKYHILPIQQFVKREMTPVIEILRKATEIVIMLLLKK